MARILVCLLALSCGPRLHAETIAWKGHQWNLTKGGMTGAAPADPANISLEKDGSLRLRIAKRNGKWTSSEMFTADNLRFGTYQWVIRGSVYDMGKSTVLGLFPYGPANKIGVDGENEIDIEFSKWNDTCGRCNADFAVYPARGHRRKESSPVWEDTFHITGGALTTARIEWSADQIVFTIMNGVQSIGTTAKVMWTKTYSSDAANIPQDASPVGINLWCFEELPANDQSAVIQDFQFISR